MQRDGLHHIRYYLAKALREMEKKRKENEKKEPIPEQTNG